jgi:AcrR family transcriptional regulator
MSLDAGAEETAYRRPLNRDRVLRAAVELADGEGVGALTMRRLAQSLGVEAMSLYHHVANKEALLDGVIEVVMDEVNAAVANPEEPAAPDDWRTGMRARVLAARAVMLRHRWAPGVLETRTTISPQVIAYFDGSLGIMIRGGFSYDLAHHAMHALGSRALGFMQELFEPDDPTAADVQAEEMMPQIVDSFPYVAGMMAAAAHGADGQLGWCDDQFEFEFGLDVILDGLERRRIAQADSPEAAAPSVDDS